MPPRFTKQYWADWQQGGAASDDDDRPTGRRKAVRPSAAQRVAVDPRQLDPRKTVVDQMVQLPDSVRFSTPKGAAAAAPQETESVSHAEPPKSQSPAGAGLVRGRPDSVISRKPPTIAVATHGFGGQQAMDERLLMLSEPDSDRSAAFRVLRHQVVRQGDPQVIVVSSALPREGKTTTAVNLALALAECGRARVLLAEANFTRPCLSQVFGFTPPWCFIQQVVEHRTLAESTWSVVEVPPHGLHVAAVDLRTERRALLDAPAFAFAIEQMRMAGYDYIVLDGPSVLGSAEVNLLQDSADGILLVARSTQSHRKQLRACIEQLAPETILGVALLQS